MTTRQQAQQAAAARQAAVARQRQLRTQSRGVPAQLPQLHPTHQQTPQASQASQQQRQRQQTSQASQRQASQQQRQPQRQPSQASQASQRGRPKRERPDPVSETQVGLTDEQKSQIERYIQLDDQISVLNEQVGRMRAERKQLENGVLSIVRPLQSGSLRTHNNVILRAKKKITRESINQKFWARKLAESGQLRDPTQSDALVKSIYKNRGSTEDYELTRDK